MAASSSADSKATKAQRSKSDYRKRNMTLHKTVDGFAEELMQLDGHEAFAPFMASLIRDEYQRRGLGKLRELMALRGVKTAEELFDLLLRESKQYSSSPVSTVNDAHSKAKADGRARRVWDATKPGTGKGSASR